MAMTKKDIPKKYINIVRNMHRDVKTNVWTSGEKRMFGQVEGKLMIFELQLAFIKAPPSLVSFVAVLNELSHSIQGDMPWCMLFPNDIVLVDKTTEG